MQRRFGAAFFFAALAAGLPQALPVAAQSVAPRAPANDSVALLSRIDRLEQQVANLQAVISAVESLAKSNATHGSGYAAATASGSSGEQVRQLSEQIADLTRRLERLEARGSSPSPAAAAPAADQSRYGQANLPSGFENKEQLPPLSTSPGASASRLANAAAPAGTKSQRQPGSYDSVAVAPVPAEGAASQPNAAKALFDQGYTALNQREYSSAEGYFQQFLERYPTDPLAPSAQYWLGETAFISGEYRAAADRFLKTFTAYPNSERAPEALLKLAISLRRLGENSAACDSFAELERRYPQAPKSIQQRAETEKRRANCG